MRITAEAREATRQKILEAAEARFRAVGFEATTTRDIAQAAGIATGTLFNYFPTKESLVCGLITARSPRAVRPKEETYASLEEGLFAYAHATLKGLKPYRRFLKPILEADLSPLVSRAADDFGSQLRTGHLEGVHEVCQSFVAADRLSPVALQMYWTLYLGVIGFWIGDQSPKQEDTLALLDQSMGMFAGWLLRDE